MFIMLPVMLAARKIDGEDPNIVFMLRALYGAVQAVAVLVVLFIYTKAAAAADEKANEGVTIYVPPPPVPFEDPNAKKKYQEKSLTTHLVTTARSLVGSTLFGIVMTVGLHMWKGMIVGLAIQSIMCPFNLAENPLVSAVFFKGGLNNLKEKRIFGEKFREEMEDGDEITDEAGNTISFKKTDGKSGGKGKSDNNKKKAVEQKKSFEDILLDTWDLGAEADVAPLLAELTKKNINYTTKENGWTPVMIMSGLGCKNVDRALKKMKELGANPEIVDKEGWNALHWAAFHGSAEAAKVLLSKSDFDGITLGLHTVADKEGKMPGIHAKEEGNDDVAKVIAEAEATCAATADAGADEGLRKRK